MTESSLPSPTPAPTAQPQPAGPLPRRRRRAGPYLRLLWLVPGLALLAAGWWGYRSAEPGGMVDAVKLTTKPGPVGQAAEAVRLVKPGTADYFLKVETTLTPTTPAPETLRLSTFKDMPLGNGLTWPLDAPRDVWSIRQVQVWDENVFKDEMLDQVTLNEPRPPAPATAPSTTSAALATFRAKPEPTWAADGQTFRVELRGTPTEPPGWAIPVGAVGATLTLVALLRFVWDQVV